MGKKNSGGKNFKKQKKDSSEKRERELVFREDEQAYARIIKSFGDARFECQLFESDENKIGHVRGAFRKRVWMNVGDIVLVSLRDFDKSKCDIIHKYTTDEAINLKSMGEIPANINLQATAIEINEGIDENPDDVGFSFEDI